MSRAEAEMEGGSPREERYEAQAPLATRFAELGGSHSLASVLNDPAVERIAGGSLASSASDPPRSLHKYTSQPSHSSSAPPELSENASRCLDALAAPFRKDNNSDANSAGSGIQRALSSVPAVFFHRSVDLSDPSIFKSIVDDAGSSSTEDVTERLDKHADTIEACLLSEVAARADEFPNVFSKVYDVSQHVTALAQLATGARKRLGSAHSAVEQHTSRVHRLQRRRQNLQSLCSACENLCCACRARDAALTLATANDFLGALGAADEAEKHLREIDPNYAKSLQCAHSVQTSVSEARENAAAKALTSLVDAALSNESVDSLASKALSLFESSCRKHEIREADQSRSHGREGEAESLNDSNDDHHGLLHPATDSLIDKESVQVATLALLRARKLPEALGRFKVHLIARLKSIFGECLNRIVPELIRTWDQDAVPLDRDRNKKHSGSEIVSLGEGDGSLLSTDDDIDGEVPDSEKLREGPPNAEHALANAKYSTFVAALQSVSEALLSDLRVASVALKCIEDICEAHEYGKSARNDADFIASPVQVAQARIARALACRRSAEDGIEGLRSSEASRLADSLRFFLREAENLSSRRCTMLRTSIHSHAKACLNNIHQKCQEQLSSELDKERWIAVDPSAELRRCISSILAEPEAETPKGSQEKDSARAMSNEHQEGLESVQSGPTETVRVNNREIATCGSVERAVCMLEDYRSLALSSPDVATEVTSRVSDLVRLFNSRMCQLVLGGGASKTSGIKSITAKNVATADQAVVLLLELLPALRAHLSASQPTNHDGLIAVSLDKAIGDLRAHKEEMHSRFESLAKSRATQHLSRMRKQAEGSWVHENAESQKSYEPSSYTSALVKEVATLARALRPLLQPEEKQSVFNSVAQAVDCEASSQLSSTLSECSASQRVCVQCRADAAVLAAEVPYRVDGFGSCSRLTELANSRQ